MGFDPKLADLYLNQPNTHAWQLAGLVFVLSDIIEGHRAELRVFPLDPVVAKDNDIKLLLKHIFTLFNLRVIYAIVPVEGADIVTAIATRIGFRQDGVLRDHRMSADGLTTSDDLIFTVKNSWLRSGPQLAPPLKK